MRKLNVWMAGLALAAAAPAALPASVDTGPDVAEPGSIEAIAPATTEARFLSPWVATCPHPATVPSPRAFLAASRGRPASSPTPRQARGLLPRAGRGFAAREALHHRQERGRPRHRDARDRRRGRHPRPRPAEGRHRRPRRSAHDRSGRGREAHRRRRAPSTTSTPSSTPTRPAAPRRCSSWPTAWPSRSSR